MIRCWHVNYVIIFLFYFRASACQCTGQIRSVRRRYLIKCVVLPKKGLTNPLILFLSCSYSVWKWHYLFILITSCVHYLYKWILLAQTTEKRQNHRFYYMPSHFSSNCISFFIFLFLSLIFYSALLDFIFVVFTVCKALCKAHSRRDATWPYLSISIRFLTQSVCSLISSCCDGTLNSPTSLNFSYLFFLSIIPMVVSSLFFLLCISYLCTFRYSTM